MKKIILGFVLCTTILAGCNNKTTQNEPAADPVDSTVVSSSAPAESTEESEPAAAADNSDFAARSSALKDYLEAESLEVLATEETPIVTEQGKLSVSIDSYQLVEITDFHNNFKTPFDGQTATGGVLLANMTVTNNSSDLLYYSLTPDIEFTGARKAFTNNQTLVEDPTDNYGKISFDNKGEIPAGESITGTLNYAFSGEELDTILDLGLVTMTIPAGYTEADTFSTDKMVGSKTNIQLAFTTDGADTVAENSSFLQDKLSTQDMGTKTLDRHKSGIDETQTVDGLDITLSEYQFTLFEPNADNASRFSNFETGVAILTAKFDLNNTGDKEIPLNMISGVLNMNDDAQWTTNDGVLTEYGSADVVRKGDEKELLIVFALDQEQYEKIWRDKDFSIKLRIYDADIKEIGKGAEILFDLPK